MSSPESPGPGSRRCPRPGPAPPIPTSPGHGTDAYRVLRYELELDYKLASNRLNGRAVLHAVAARTDVRRGPGPDRASGP